MALRKLIHVSVGTLAILLYLSGYRELLFYLSLAFVLVNAILWKFADLPYEDKRSYGTILFPLSVALITYLSHSKTEIFIVSLAPMFFSDPIASMLGSKFPYMRMINNKTVIGSLGFMLSSFVIALFVTKNVLLSFTFACILSIVELLSSRGLDNLSVPTVAFVVYTSYSYELALSLVFASLVAFAAYRFSWLTLDGALCTLVLGTFILFFGGFSWVFPLLLFLTLGSLISRKNGSRDAKQVLANGGVSLVLSYMYHLTGSHVFYSAHVVAVSSMMSDTFSSEMGMRFSRKAYWILDPRKIVSKGTSGGVSFEGFLWGIFGALLVSVFDVQHFPYTAFFGMLGNIMDSMIGATLETKDFWNNDLTNLSACVLSVSCYLVFHEVFLL